MPVHRPRSIEEVIEGFSPTSVGESAAAVARQVVAQAHPANAERAKAMLCAASKLAQFALNVGLVPTAEMVTDDALIERFILGGTDGFSGATRRTLRTNLRALARALAPAPGAVGLPVNGPRLLTAKTRWPGTWPWRPLSRRWPDACALWASSHWAPGPG
jgi:hypothetical protein